MPKTVNVDTSHMQKLIKMQRCPNTPQLTVQSATTSTVIVIFIKHICKGLIMLIGLFRVKLS